MPPVPEDGIVLGSALATTENLKISDKATILGQDLKVVNVYPRYGDKRDITAWIHLDLMQRLFKKEGLINAIWALECSCAMADVGKVREEIGKILPDVEIEEQGEKALARAEARKKAEEAAKASLTTEKEDRERLLALGGRFRFLLVPLIVASAGIWLGLLASGNVRDRRQEIGLFRALGVGSLPIFRLLVSRAVVIGLAGAAAGYAAGVFLGAAAFSASSEAAGGSNARLFEPGLFVSVLILAPVLSALASWLPALAATRQDPAVVLREE